MPQILVLVSFHLPKYASNLHLSFKKMFENNSAPVISEKIHIHTSSQSISMLLIKISESYNINACGLDIHSSAQRLQFK